MFGYYGSKSKIIKKYTPPKYDKIIEPFAGTAQYSLLYYDRKVTLIEKYDVIVKIFKWLQSCSQSDILSAPIMKCGEHVDDYKWSCQEQKWMAGFIITGAPSMPKKTASKWKTVIRPNTQNYKYKMIAESLHKIKHWDIIHGDYQSIANQEATWFIDPPYKYGGEHYRHGNKDIDYAELASYCKERKGHVIVCENSRAEWLPFEPLTEMQGVKKRTLEVCYEHATTI
jgi:site-specific DNA-adenine methylase